MGNQEISVTVEQQPVGAKTPRKLDEARNAAGAAGIYPHLPDRIFAELSVVE